MFFEKKNIKKIVILSFFIIALCLPVFVFSQNFGLDNTAVKAGYEKDQTDIFFMIANIIRMAFGAMAFIFFGLTLYAGLRWLTARGKEELIERAKATMEQAIIGLVIVSLSYAITSFIMDRLSVVPVEKSTSKGKDSCIGACSPGHCSVGETISDNGSCISEGYVCCIKNSCCICTDNNIGVVASDPKIMMDVGAGGINCSNYCKNLPGMYPNSLIGSESDCNK